MSKPGSDSPTVSLNEDVAQKNTKIEKGDVVVHHCTRYSSDAATTVNFHYSMKPNS